ncbi:MAG: hypothetical protein AAF846_01380 [Chloroflexota bacterium]
MPIIQVVIFRGTGGVYNVDHPYCGEPALVRAGHVGVIGVIKDKIIGFHPTPDATEALGSEKLLLNALKDKVPQPSCLQDDSRYFERAYQLRDATNGRTAVYMYEVEISDKTFDEIRTWYNEGKEALYNFPNDDGQFEDKQSNCAMFWVEWFNIPLPERTGKIRRLTEKMRIEEYDLWHPND